MKKRTYKFISSKSNLLALLILLLLCIPCIIYIFNNMKSIWLIIPIIFILMIFILCIVFCIKTVYFVFVYDDRFVFVNLIGKKKICMFSEIKNVIMAFIDRTNCYYLITEKEKNFLKLSFPFKIPVNYKTTNIINDFWKKEIKNLKSM